MFKIYKIHNLRPYKYSFNKDGIRYYRFWETFLKAFLVFFAIFPFIHAEGYKQ